MNKRILSLMLLTCILASLPACGNGDSGQTERTETTSGSDETTAAETTVANDKDELPEVDYNGATFKYLAAESTAYKGYLDVDEITGDVLNDGIYNCYRNVEKRLNIVFEQEILGAVAANDTGGKLIMAGDHQYELISLTDRNALSYAVQGMLLSYATMPNVDLSKTYWCQSINESMSIGGENWLAYGDFNLSVYDYTFALAFNKQLFDELGLDDPYELVNSGAWTFDAFNKMCISAVSDLNGDTVMDDQDRYGWSAIPKQISPTMWVAAGAQSIKKDKDDLPYFSMPSDEFFAEVYDKIVDLAWTNDAWYNPKYNGNVTDLPMFQNGNSLFQTTSFGMLDKGYYREMKIDYGVLPHPKWDEAQDSYYSRVEGGRIFAIPITCPDPEMVGTVLEAISYQASVDIIPAYFEVALKTKYTRDDESSRMFDIIMDTRVYDLGDTYWCSQIRDDFILDLFSYGDRELASAIASSKTTVEGAISETISALTK